MEMLRNSLTKGTPWNSVSEFAVSDKYCGLTLYPRQHTLLKLVFLETEQMTQYDLDVIEEWRTNFTRVRDVFGVQPDIWERVEYLRRRGYRRFPHVQFVLGRRASKGYLGAIIITEMIAYLISLDNPQAHYGIMEGKDVFCNIGATSQTQAQRHQFADVRNVVEHCAWLEPYIAETKDHQLRLRTPADLRNIAGLKAREIDIEHTIATLWVVALSASSVAGRGATSYVNAFDEFAFLVSGSGSVKSSEEIYEDWQPSLGQFKKDALTFVPSSPFTKIGKFFELYQHGRVLMSNYRDETGLSEQAQSEIKNIKARADLDEVELSAEPGMLIFQGASWDLYKDWERGPELVGVRFTTAPENDLRDEEQRRRQLRNPDKFAVERCVDPSTRVLCADLIWRKIDDLSVGDRLVALDEHPPHDGFKQRKMRTATVIDKVDSFQKAYRITLDDGTSVVCSENHRWLSTSSSSTCSARWRSIAPAPKGPRTVLKPGDQIRHLVDPWEVDTSWEAGYLAGFFDGEGNFLNRGRSAFEFSFTQLPGPTLDFVVQILKDKGFGVLHRHSPREELIGQWDERYHRTHSAAQKWCIYGFDECLRFVGSFGGVRIARNITGCWEGRGLPRPRGHGRVYKTIVDIQELPEQRLVDIQTTTGTFVAEGLISHNCGQFAEVMGQYLDSAKVDAIFNPVPWRDPTELSATPFGRFDYTYRIHVDPSKTGANFALCIAHTELAPEDDFGEQWPHVIIDRLHVWQPKDFPINPETGKHEVDYTLIERELDSILYTFPSTTKFSSDQWNSAGFLQRLKKKYSPNIRVVEETATEKTNYQRAEKFKSAVNLGWVHSFRDNLYDDSQCLLELECKFLSEKNGKVYKQEYGPVTTKDLYDAVSVCVTDLLHQSLERWSGGELNAHAFGSTNKPDLTSGRAQERGAMVNRAPGIYQDGFRGAGGAERNASWDKLEALGLGTRRPEPGHYSTSGIKPREQRPGRRLR